MAANRTLNGRPPDHGFAKILITSVGNGAKRLSYLHAQAKGIGVSIRGIIAFTWRPLK